MAFIDLSKFEATGDSFSLSISTTVDLGTHDKTAGASKLFVQALGGAAIYGFSDEDPGATLHSLATGDSVLLRQQPHLKFKGTTLIVTPGR